MVHGRVILRRGGRALPRFLFRALTRLEVRGLGRVPLEGPLLVAFNHLAHLDGPLIVAFIPREVEQSFTLSDPRLDLAVHGHGERQIIFVANPTPQEIKWPRPRSCISPTRVGTGFRFSTDGAC